MSTIFLWSTIGVGSQRRLCISALNSCILVSHISYYASTHKHIHTHKQNRLHLKSWWLCKFWLFHPTTYCHRYLLSSNACERFCQSITLKISLFLSLKCVRLKEGKEIMVVFLCLLCCSCATLVFVVVAFFVISSI